MDPLTLLKVLQSGLSVVGFLTLSVWIMKWAKGLNERNKELNDIDKEIRAAMKDSFAAQRELHHIERQKLEVTLANLTDEIEKQAKALSNKNENLRTIIMSIEVASSMAMKMQSKIVDRESSQATEQFKKLIALMASSNIVPADHFYNLMKNSFRTLKDGASIGEEIAWRITEMLACTTRISAIVEAIVPMAPTALSYALNNQNATQDEIKHEITTSILQLAKKS